MRRGCASVFYVEEPAGRDLPDVGDLNKPSVGALNTNPGQDRRNRRSGETARYLTNGLTSPNLSSILGRVENIPAKTGRIPQSNLRHMKCGPRTL